VISVADLRSRARASGFDQLAEELIRLRRPALTHDARGEDGIVGRLGGRPRLPPDEPWPQTRWPNRDVEPLAFIAEFDLAMLDQSVWPGPPSGMLSVFCHINADAMYVDSGGAARLLHFPAGARLEPRPAPADLDADLQFRELPVGAEPVTTLPWIGVGPARELIPFGLDAMKDFDRAEAYCRFADEVRQTDDSQPLHQLLGWPRFVQDDIAYTWSGLHAEALEQGIVRERVIGDAWHLLLQLGADIRIGTSFGDGGDLFFAIPAGDLAAGRFDRVEAITDSG